MCIIVNDVFLRVCLSVCWLYYWPIYRSLTLDHTQLYIFYWQPATPTQESLQRNEIIISTQYKLHFWYSNCISSLYTIICYACAHCAVGLYTQDTNMYIYYIYIYIYVYMLHVICCMCVEYAYNAMEYFLHTNRMLFPWDWVWAIRLGSGQFAS